MNSVWDELPGKEGGFSCGVCHGLGGSLSWTFNPTSEQQLKVVLYEVFKLPKRFKDKKLTTDEDALKSLAAFDKTGLVVGLLKIAKTSTMRSILVRLEPGSDGRIRTFYNPAGTETGRLSSAQSFLIPSTNLNNLPKKEATKDPKYKVRLCMIPSEAMGLIEADLEGADAWSVAALSEDHALLEKLQTPGFKVHRWTASQILGKPEDEVTSVEYHLYKKARHSLNFGRGWKGYMNDVNAEVDDTGISITAKQAKDVVKGYHLLHPNLENIWWKDVDRRLREDGAITSTFGFKRTFFGRRSGWMDDVHREAIAHEPQHITAYLGLRGLLRWSQQHEGKIGWLLLQVYDSVVIEALLTRVKLAAKLLKRCLEELT
jgi:DNA polymerase-1